MRSLIIACALLAGTATAHAAPCGAFTNPVFLQVGDTQENLVKFLGVQTVQDPDRPIDLVYVTSGSCTNIDAICANTLLANGATVKYIPAGLDPTVAAPTCQLTAAQALDVANSALFVSACTAAGTPPAEVTFHEGPKQAYVFAVPEVSNEVAITAEEAYFAFGFGDQGMVTPWDDESQMFIRLPTKSTLLALAAAIAVPAIDWQGIMYDKSTEVVAALQSATDPGKAIGILGAEVYDKLRGSLDALAFQAYGQWYAYYPDSTATATDKQNVRDGHYFPWSPTVWMVRSDAPHLDDANRVVDLILGDITPTGYDPLAIEIGVGLVPDCAMQVSRELEGGPLSVYEPAQSCGCFYDSVATSTDCTACAAGTCATGTCVHGYCEE